MPGWEKFLRAHPWPAEFTKLLAAVGGMYCGLGVDSAVQLYCLSGAVQNAAVEYRADDAVGSLVRGTRSNILNLGIPLAIEWPDQLIQYAITWGKQLATTLDIESLQSFISALQPSLQLALPEWVPGGSYVQPMIDNMMGGINTSVQTATNGILKFSLFGMLAVAKVSALKTLGEKAKGFRQRELFGRALTHHTALGD